MSRNVTFWRDRHGVPHVEAQSESDLYWGHGVVHATDRAMQMLLMRILGQGRMSEFLDSGDAALRVDLFFRRMNWSADAAAQLDLLTPQAAGHLASYCEGVNSVLARKVPWEFRLLRYRPEPWRPEDTIMFSRLVGYLALQQSQAEMERLLVEMVQAGVAREKLEELFPGLLDGLDEELLKKVQLGQRVVPQDTPWGAALPAWTASNNWVISGKKTASGKPILASDPHLEGNRLPNIWCEIALHLGDRYAIGASIPGGPGIFIGRNPDVAWGTTYPFMDAVDSWIEHCRDGKHFREPDQWVPFRRRTEIVRRKNKEPVEVTFYDNHHGVLDGDPFQEGYYLATCWASAQSGAASLNQVFQMWHVKTVEEGMDALGRLETAWNFVLADRHGNIGYQMSGLLPRRRQRASGLVPLPGWKQENDWNGFVAHEELPRELNPEQGYFATANDDLNRYGKAKPINLPMGPYRADRIRQLLEAGERFTPEDMFRMQFDVESPQAAAFMRILKPLLPHTPQGDVLRDWDRRYTAESQGAFLFEQFYRCLRREVFGPGGLGAAVVDHLADRTGIFINFYLNFDRILLSEQSAWFAGRSREEIYRRAAAEALAVEPRAWGTTQQYLMKHLLLGGKLPRLLGFDRGPITPVGGRATIHQCQAYRSGSHESTFVPSYRLVTDLATDLCRTNLAGGPSDRRFSRWYTSDLANWLSGKYKTLSADRNQEKLPFK